MATSKYQIAFMERRKEKNLCLKCGNPLDREGTYCIECRKKITDETNETRHFLQNIGICPRCQKTKLFGDEKQCPECNAKAYNLVMASRKTEYGRLQYNKNHAEWAKKKHNERIEQGICTRCGKRKPDNGYKTCGICRAKDNRARLLREPHKPNRSERYKQGLCYFCDNPTKDGYKVCEKHYQMNVEKANSNKTRETREKLKTSGYLF